MAARAPILRSYAFCDDDIDLEAMTATARYSLYYVDDNGNRVDVAGADGAACQRDPDKAFPIVERAAGCFWTTSTARSCLRRRWSISTTATGRCGCGLLGVGGASAVDLTPTVGGCPLRHDFKAGVSHRQGPTYKLDGVVYQGALRRRRRGLPAPGGVFRPGRGGAVRVGSRRRRPPVAAQSRS